MARRPRLGPMSVASERWLGVGQGAPHTRVVAAGRGNGAVWGFPVLTEGRWGAPTPGPGSCMWCPLSWAEGCGHSRGDAFLRQVNLGRPPRAARKSGCSDCSCREPTLGRLAQPESRGEGPPGSGVGSSGSRGPFAWGSSLSESSPTCGTWKGLLCSWEVRARGPAPGSTGMIHGPPPGREKGGSAHPVRRLSH